MLYALELENFKAFGERTRVEFAPITLIFGENSAGKSSVLQALNLLKQTHEMGAVLLPRAEGGFSDLGSFKELLYDHDLKRSLSLRLDIGLGASGSQRSREPREPDQLSSDCLGFEVTFACPPKSSVVRLRSITLHLPDGERAVAFEPVKLARRAPRPPSGRADSPSLTSREFSSRRLSNQRFDGAKCSSLTADETFWIPYYTRAKESANDIVRLLKGSDPVLDRIRLEWESLQLRKAEVATKLAELGNELAGSQKELARMAQLQQTIEDLCLRMDQLVGLRRSKEAPPADHDSEQQTKRHRSANSMPDGDSQADWLYEHRETLESRRATLLKQLARQEQEGPSQADSQEMRLELEDLDGQLRQAFSEYGYRKSRVAQLNELQHAHAARRAEESDIDSKLAALTDMQEKYQFASPIQEAISFYESDFSLPSFVSRMRAAQSDVAVGIVGFAPFPLESHLAERLPELKLAEQKTQVSGICPDVASFAAIASGALEQALRALFPLGPYRRPPERWYIFTGTRRQDVGYRGDLLPDLLFGHPKLVEETNEWLDRLEIGYRIRIQSLGSKARNLFEVRLSDKRRKRSVDVALSDVGFGISQILPFVVQTLAGIRQIIAIEQPEVHIHPRLQADLGDLLIHGIQNPRGHRFIVETHSEHLILRLLRRIRETCGGGLPDGHPGLRPNQLSVVYVERGQSGSRAHRLRIDETGEFIDRWPQGFFEERSRELF